MASVFKKQFKARNKVYPSRCYYVDFRDHRGTTQRVKTFSHKSAAAEFGRRVERLVAYYLASGGRIDGESLAWVKGLPESIRDRLVKIGLVDLKLLGDTCPLSEHLAEFRHALEAKGTGLRQVEDITKRAQKVIDDCGFRTHADIDAGKVENYLHELRSDRDGRRGVSAQTSNHYLGAIRQFCRWMVRSGRVETSPLEGIAKQNVDADVRHERRALEVEEAMRLLNAARGGEVREGRRLGGKEPRWRMTGPERALLYQLMLETGLRAGEVRSLTRVSFDLDGDPPAVAVKAKSAKNRKRGNVVPLRPALAAMLRPVLAGLDAGDPLFRLPPKEHMVELLRGDLAAAGISYRDEEGRVVDMHSLRHTCATWLAEAGVSPKTAQEILRHSSITLTMDRYTHSSRRQNAEAVARLPSLRAGSA